MRDNFHHQLDVLELQLADMCDLAAAAIRHATNALVHNDFRLADRVVADDVTLDAARTTMEHDALTLLALQSPVATDLRRVLAAVYSAENIERMGDLAHHIALAVTRRRPAAAIPATLSTRFDHMGAVATELATTAGRAIRTHNQRLVETITVIDDDIDDLHRSLFPVVSCTEWLHGTRTAVDAVMISRNYERFADHAVTVAGRVTARVA
ncbi:PhoU-like phosphate uptake regulator [Herbihabitans rhizosphaerae]|uniref:Phosphate-specific transport system accessory protein PhoU n=1 Tax=Herbihabitans rhizosphaerae TaxID=1872711 RepID=A0A4Q7KDE7_9PSEU|nr:phosphate signaling complex protein PhoU [Herbihabitans rhizosphaerae]RZS31156.1 PhoU-like phosphate uptake regulator [Herbihabitans rhizosphaerae]